MTKDEAKYIMLHASNELIRREAAFVFNEQIKKIRKSVITRKIDKWELAELKKDYKAHHRSTR